jgi:hypothetical protein
VVGRQTQTEPRGSATAEAIRREQRDAAAGEISPLRRRGFRGYAESVHETEH